MDGKGMYSWADGRKYEGEFLRDKKHGYGIYTWPDGRRFEGNWRNGKQDGKSKYFSKGRIQVGIWKEGVRTEWLEEIDEKGNKMDISAKDDDHSFNHHKKNKKLK